jgi:hypothetical protein
MPYKTDFRKGSNFTKFWIILILAMYRQEKKERKRAALL